MNTKHDPIPRGHVGSTGNQGIIYNKKGDYSKFGNTNSNFTELDFQRVRSRRQMFDMVKEYILRNNNVDRNKIVAYFQYTTGATAHTIYEALSVLEELGLISANEIMVGPASYLIVYTTKNDVVSKDQEGVVK